MNDQDLKAWAQSPGTREFRDRLLADRLDVLEAWAGGSFSGPAEVGVQQNAAALGKVAAIEDIIEYLDDLMATA